MIREHIFSYMDKHVGEFENGKVAADRIRQTFPHPNDRRLAWTLWNTPRSSWVPVLVAFHHGEAWDEMHELQSRRDVTGLPAHGPPHPIAITIRED